jgi:hypothetical protein
MARPQGTALSLGAMRRSRHRTRSTAWYASERQSICDAEVVTDAAEPRPQDLESRLVPVRWDHAIALDDRRVRIIALMGTSPPARVEVVDRPASVVITLFERRPPRLSPDGIPIPYHRFLIGIPASFDILLPAPLHGRRLIDGVTGFDPNTVKRGGHRERIDARAVDKTQSRVEVPIGRTFDWRELTGRPWFDFKTSDNEPIPPAAETTFFSSSGDTPTREQPEGG